MFRGKEVGLPASGDDAAAELERFVAGIWEQVLGMAPGSVTPTDNFLVIGGESLLALRAVSHLRYALVEAGSSLAPEDATQPVDADPDEAQFGMMSGAFAVQHLLAAPCLRAYSQHLRGFGYGAPLRGVRGEVAGGASLPAAGDADASHVVLCDWPRVRDTARRTDASAATELSVLMDTGQPSVLAWCGAEARRGRRGNGAGATGRFTALHAAAQGGAVDCLKLLLSRRARPTVVEGGAAMTPAHYAAMNSAACLELLIDAKAPVTLRDVRGQSLVHAAARTGNCESLRYLMGILCGAEGSTSQGLPRALRSGQGHIGLLEWSDRWSRTAVHWAVLNGHAAALTILLEGGAQAAPPRISTGQMTKRTHLVQEQPMDIALRVHGAESDIAGIISQALDESSAASRKTNVRVGTDAKEPIGSIAPGVQEASPNRFLLTLSSESGLSRFGVWELQERVQAEQVSRTQCRIFFESGASPRAFLPLKSAERVCAVVLYADARASAMAEIERLAGLPPERDEVIEASREDLPGKPRAPSPAERALASWVSGLESWAGVREVWQRFNAELGPQNDDGKPLRDAPLTFKVSCRRSGKRFAHVSTMRLAVALASALQARHGWEPRVRRPDFVVRLLLNDGEMLVDLPLLGQASIKTGGGQLCTAGMAAPVAWAMARSAELQPGDRVLDPMCGRAVILIEAAQSWPRCTLVGSDLDREQLLGAEANVRLAAGAGNARVELMHCDARHLPWPDGSVDALICDVPFGKQYCTEEECRSGLYDAIMREFDRVVCPWRGRAVLLVSQDMELWLLNAAGFDVSLPARPQAMTRNSWVCAARRELKLGFLEAVIVVLHRPTAAAATASATGASNICADSMLAPSTHGADIDRDNSDGLRRRQGKKGRGKDCANGGAGRSGSAGGDAENAAAPGEAVGSLLPARSGRLWWESQGGRSEWASLKVGVRPPMRFTRGCEI